MSTVLEKELTCKAYSRIDDVPVEHWGKLLSDGPIAYSPGYLRAIEQSGVGGLQDFHYIIMHEGEVPVCIATCYSFHTDLCEYTNNTIKSIVSYVRRYFPNLFFIKILECGSAISINASPFVVAPNIKPGRVIPILKRCLKDIGSRVRATVIGIKDLSHDLIKTESMEKLISQDDFTIICSVPGTFIPVRWSSIDGYVGSLKSYYRSKLNKHLRRNVVSNISSVLVEDFSTISDKLAQQWITVHQNTKEPKREVLNATFYSSFSSELGNESKVLLFYSGEKLVGHALLACDKKILRWLYIGKNSVGGDSLYIYMMYKVIETGILLGFDAIDCGPTTYDIKRDLGVRIDRQYYAMALISPYLRKFSAPVFRKLSNQNVPRNKNTFKA
jgi:predicted N-acyltransferase